jgi:predicted NUDIX family NTP pyrophosphohydrolase
MGGPFWAHKDERAWTIPKGEYGADEAARAAACREFTEEMGSAPPDPADWRDLGEVRQSNGKVVTVWGVVGDFDVSSQRSNTFEMEWPPRSGRTQAFPEVDRAEWFVLADARRKIVTAQQPFLDRLEALAVDLGEPPDGERTTT